MKYKTLKVPFRKLKWIAHTADIHIRNLKRHAEYREVFERFYEKVKSYGGNGMIYIGGDIAHAKTQMSPELVFEISNFLKNCADIAPTVIIPGNHDCNLNNKNRMDVLTPIIKNLEHPNLHYLVDSGAYKLADVTLVVMSIFDKPTDFIKAKDVEGLTKIAFHHGTVSKAEIDNGFKLTSNVTINRFAHYDMVLLGDIHKHQFLGSKKTVAYCGSLICQNHGESLDKGFMYWDVPTRKGTFVPVYNDYGYYTLNIDEGVVPDVDDMPKKARLRVKVSNTDSSQMKLALTEIRKKYGVTDVAVNRVDSIQQQKSWDRNAKISIGDVTSVEYQNGLIQDYLSRNFAIDTDMISKVIDINKELNFQLPEEEVVRNVVWKLKKFEFSNMFSYGENNVVDFTKLGGIVGLFAANASGKSSLFDALSFCLFDTSSRAFKAVKVMNNKKNTFDCKITLDIGGVEHCIYRNAKRLKNGSVKVDVDFWKKMEDGEIISLNGDQRRTTNANIRKVIGTYEDFVLTSLSVQNNFTVFIDKTQKERKELLAQFMGIGIFDELYQLAYDNIAEVRAILKDFKKRDHDEELSEVERQKEIYQRTYDKLVQKRDDLEEENKKLKESVFLLHKKLKPIDASISDIDLLQSSKQELEESLSSHEKRIEKLDSDIELVGEKIKKLTVLIEEFEEDDIDSKYKEYLSHKEDRDNTKIEIDKLKIDIKHKLDKMEKLTDLEYDPDCEFCMNNIFVKDAIETKKKLEHDRVLATNYVKKLDQLDELIGEMSNVEEDKSKYDQAKEILRELDQQDKNLLSEKIVEREKQKSLLRDIKEIDEKIKQYYLKEEDILSNNKINEEIESFKEEIEQTDEQISELNEKLQAKHSSIRVSDTKRQQILDDIEKVRSLEKDYEAYEYYLDAVKRDGISYELIEKSLPTIEGAVNDILAQIVDFNIALSMDGKNINAYIVYDEDNLWPLELNSGMESFVASLAIRIGLINVSNLPRTDSLFVDEGWGNLDADNLSTVGMLFDYLKTQFPFVLIISHLESMRDVVDTIVEVDKRDNFSNVNYC